MLAYIKDGDDIRMVQGCGGLSLEFKSTQTVGLTRTIRWQDFDGDLTFHRQVAGAIYLAHSARSEERDYLIGTQPGSRCKGHMFTGLYRRDMCSSGWPEDFHLQVTEHAQHTTKPLARRTLPRG